MDAPGVARVANNLHIYVHDEPTCLQLAGPAARLSKWTHPPYHRVQLTTLSVCRSYDMATSGSLRSRHLQLLRAFFEEVSWTVLRSIVMTVSACLLSVCPRA